MGSGAAPGGLADIPQKGSLRGTGMQPNLLYLFFIQKASGYRKVLQLKTSLNTAADAVANGE
jgi:hypothetical protein